MSNQFSASLWGDEAFSAVLSMNPVPKILEVIIRDTSPPLYNLTLHFWYQIFGTSEVAIRMLSFLYYVLAIFFVCKIGCLIWNRKTGLIVSILTFFNPFFFIYAFEGRMYSIMALGVTASMYFFLKRNWVGYVLATTWALYSHHFAIFALFIQGLWFLYELSRKDKKIAKSIFKSFVAIGVLYTPWLWPLYKQTTMVGGGFWLGTPTLSDLTNLISDYLARGIKHPLSNFALYSMLATLVLRKWGDKKEKTLFLLTWFLGPILLTWLVSQKFQSIFYNRYLLYAIPGSMIIAGSNLRKLSWIPLLATLSLFLIIDINYFTNPTKRPFKELAAYVHETKEDDYFLINWNSGAHHLWETKYYDIPAPIYIPEGDLPFYVGTAQMTDADILRIIPEAKKRIGVVTSGNPNEVELPGFDLESEKQFGDLKFLWFTKK